MASILDAQQNRLNEIGHEWKLNTEEKVRLQDPAIYAILTNLEYALATQLPDGNYSAQTCEFSGVPTTPSTPAQSTVIGASNTETCRAAAQNDAPACFIIGDTQKEMNDVIGSNIVSKVNQLIADHPIVSSILLNNVPGSMDGVFNIVAAKIVYYAGLNTELSASSKIASGGVDFFLAGNIRIILTKNLS